MAGEPSKVSAAGVVRLATGVYRTHTRRVVHGVLAFLVVPAAAQSVLYEVLVRGEDARTPAVAIVGGLIATISSVGIVLFAGYLDVVVEHHTTGTTPGSLATMTRRLPVVPLLVANLLLSVLVGIGLVLLVIPGLIVMTWFCLVGPAIVSGGATSVPDAFRRSRALVHGHFWFVFLLVTTPLALEHWFVHAIDVHLDGASPLLAFATSLVVFLTVNAAVGLLEVATASSLRAASTPL